MSDVVIAREPCPNCGSRDNLIRYSDGHGHCFGCQHHEPPTHGRKVEEPKTEWKQISGSYRDLPDRGLREETLKFWKYQVGYIHGKPAHIATYRDETGKLVAQKYRLPGKEFKYAGEKDPPLYGAWLWGKGKSIVITEGEIDAMSVSQAFGLKWPVVSLPNGASSVKKTLKRSYDYLSHFDKIVLMFDQDEPGQKAIEEAVELLPAGKVYIASLPEKDANEVLLKHGEGKLVDCFWQAKPYRPDGIVAGVEIPFDMLRTTSTKGYPLRIPELNNRLLGMRKGEITLFTAGSGIGKSTMVRQISYEMHQDHKLSFGNVFLEESNVKTAQAYIALHNQVPLGRLRYDTSILSEEQWRRGYDEVVANRMFFYDHFGSLESSRLISKLHYLATHCGVDFICLDHISIVVSGLESSSEGERKDIDILMTRLRSLVEETGVGVLGVVHLKRAIGKNFNEGDQVSLTDLRGSAALEQLSDNVISLERDQQGDDRDKSIIRLLKCRETGDTGEADTMYYDRVTGLMKIRTFEQTSNANVSL